MELIHEHRDRATVVRLKGMLDASTAKAFKENLTALIQERRLNLVLDLGGVGFIDSSGLGSIISVLRQTHQEGGDVKLAAPQERIRAIFELTRLDKVFDICEDTETAIRRFTAG